MPLEFIHDYSKKPLGKITHVQKMNCNTEHQRKVDGFGISSILAKEVELIQGKSIEFKGWIESMMQISYAKDQEFKIIL